MIALEVGKTVDPVEFIGVFLSTARGGGVRKVTSTGTEEKKSESMAQRRLDTRDENNKKFKSRLYLGLKTEEVVVVVVVIVVVRSVVRGQ